MGDHVADLGFTGPRREFELRAEWHGSHPLSKSSPLPVDLPVGSFTYCSTRVRQSTRREN